MTQKPREHKAGEITQHIRGSGTPHGSPFGNEQAICTCYGVKIG